MMTRAVLLSAMLLLCAGSALADLAQNECLVDPARTVFTLPGGIVGDQDRFVNGESKQTVSGAGYPPTHIVVPIEDKWGLRIRRPGGKVGTTDLPTCIVGVQVDGQCGMNVTWEQCKASFDKGGIHIPNQPLTGGGDAEVHNVLVRDMEDGVLTPRSGGLHADGSDLHFSCTDCVLVRIRDDAFEADGCPSVTLTDSYLNGFTGISYRPGSGFERITNDPVITIQGTVLVDLICQAGEGDEGHQCQAAGQTIGRLWKPPGSLSSCTPEPRLVIDGDFLVRLEDGDPAKMTWPDDVTINGTATVYWNGPGEYPGYSVLPEGVAVVEHDDAAFRQAVSQFRLARGCASDFSSCTWEVVEVPALSGWSLVFTAFSLLMVAGQRLLRRGIRP